MRSNPREERDASPVREAWRWIAPALLLVLVAAHQIFLAHTAHLDPWKGGGFGMFASTTGSESRHTHLFAIRSGNIETEVDLPERLEEAEDRLLALPTPGRLDHFARALSAALEGEHSDLVGVRVELWLTGYDVADLTPETGLLLSHDHRIDSHERR